MSVRFLSSSLVPPRSASSRTQATPSRQAPAAQFGDSFHRRERAKVSQDVAKEEVAYQRAYATPEKLSYFDFFPHRLDGFLEQYNDHGVAFLRSLLETEAFDSTDRYSWRTALSKVSSIAALGKSRTALIQELEKQNDVPQVTVNDMLDKAHRAGIIYRITDRVTNPQNPVDYFGIPPVVREALTERQITLPISGEAVADEMVLQPGDAARPMLDALLDLMAKIDEMPPSADIQGHWNYSLMMEGLCGILLVAVNKGDLQTEQDERVARFWQVAQTKRLVTKADYAYSLLDLQEAILDLEDADDQEVSQKLIEAIRPVLAAAQKAGLMPATPDN